MKSNQVFRVEARKLWRHVEDQGRYLKKGYLS